MRCRIVCTTGPVSAAANGSVVVTIGNYEPAVAAFAYKVSIQLIACHYDNSVITDKYTALSDAERCELGTLSAA